MDKDCFTLSLQAKVRKMQQFKCGEERTQEEMEGSAMPKPCNQHAIQQYLYV